MKLTFLGHACFDLFDGKYHVLTDPFLTGNALAAAKADEVAADFICVSHNHGDHIGDAIAIAKRTGATIVGVAEQAGLMGENGVSAALGNLGGWIPLPFGRVKLVQAIHGSGLPGALACGFVIEIGGKKIYHAGDTAYYSDMALLADEKLDAALLPIGDFYTMGPADAARAAKVIGAKVTVPMHYNTFPPIKQDPAAFAALCEGSSKVVVLAPGESVEL
ncbi:MAG: metal-dependent hydrolase [Pyramidobacter sp.]|nr:metal-dependent hydrolase [Pyramidobacter sp.]MBQ8090658.1 metal-dependent hydrolase [Pyramidobacter sp.]MBR0108217.1 metal-dependent hydrolase [Pyramidobacter sp.]